MCDSLDDVSLLCHIGPQYLLLWNHLLVTVLETDTLSSLQRTFGWGGYFLLLGFCYWLINGWVVCAKHWKFSVLRNCSWDSSWRCLYKAPCASMRGFGQLLDQRVEQLLSHFLSKCLKVKKTNVTSWPSNAQNWHWIMWGIELLD